MFATLIDMQAKCWSRNGLGRGTKGNLNNQLDKRGRQDCVYGKFFNTVKVMVVVMMMIIMMTITMTIFFT
jgi:hypothetical protein